MEYESDKFHRVVSKKTEGSNSDQNLLNSLIQPFFGYLLRWSPMLDFSYMHTE